MRAALLLPTLALVRAELMARHDHHGGHGAEPDSPAVSAVSAAKVFEAAPLPATSASPSAMPSHGHGHAHGPPPAHNHNPHAPVKEFLDDVALHELHDFPPTYMDADFRLTNDSVIFGEVFPDDWDPETVASHPGLMFAHVGCMIAAYFALMPISAS